MAAHRDRTATMADRIRMNPDRRVSRMPVAPPVGSAVTIAHPSQRDLAIAEFEATQRPEVTS